MAEDKVEKGGGRSSMGRSMVVNFLGIFCSRVFGLARDMMMTWYWGGSGAAQAAFHLAFSIPNMFRSLFGEGAFTAAFVPAVSSKLEEGDRQGAWRLAERVISLQICALLAVVLLVSGISGLLFVFFADSVKDHVGLTFKILPVLMPYALLICLAGSFASILNSLRNFALPSLNPVIFNICQIAALIALGCIGMKNDEPGALYWFCASVLLAGALQIVSLMLACRRHGFAFHFHPVWNDPEVRGVCMRFLPGTIGAGASQINQLFDKIMVAWLGPLAVSSIAYSNHLVYMPVGLFGVAMGVVCLTNMSRAASRNDQAEMASSMDFALRTVLFLSLPCAVLFGVLAEPIVRLMYQRGAYTDEAVGACVWALVCYLPGLPAFCCLKVATNPHHANKDTLTPVKVALVCIGLNLILNLALLLPMRQGGLALSTSICSWVNVIALLVLARKYVKQWRFGSTIRSGAALLFASAVGGVAAFYLLHSIPIPKGLTGWHAQFWTVAICGIGGYMAYIITCLAMRRPELRELLASVRKRK